MVQEHSKQKISTPRGLTYAVYVSLAALVGVMGWITYDMAPKIVRSTIQYRHALSHLDPNAVSPKESPFTNDFSTWGGVAYEDPDGDGDYDSILQRKNSDGEFVHIPIRKGLEGKIEFLNLSETAVDPLNIPRNPWGLKLDYVDIDGDGKLESITYFGLNGENAQRMKIENIEGKYVLSNL